MSYDEVPAASLTAFPPDVKYAQLYDDRWYMGEAWRRAKGWTCRHEYMGTLIDEVEGLDDEAAVRWCVTQALAKTFRLYRTQPQPQVRGFNPNVTEHVDKATLRARRLLRKEKRQR